MKMDKTKALLIITLFFLVVQMCLPIVCSAPPFTQTTDFTSGYKIKIPNFGTLKQNQDFEFSFHIYNISDGMPIDGTSTTCQFHLFNVSGDHIYTSNNITHTTAHGVNNEWEVEVDGGNFSYIGDYCYLIQCNSTSLGGFESVAFKVTGTGFEFSQPRAIFSLGLLGVLIFLFIVNLGATSKLPSKDNYDDEGILMSINQLKYLRPVLWVVTWFIIIAIVFTGSNIAFAYMGTTLLANILFTTFKIMLALSLPMVIVWFTYLFYSMFRDRQMKTYLDRGWE